MPDSFIEQLAAGKHLAWIYNSDAERLHIAVPFIKQALNESGKCLVVSSDILRGQLVQALEKDGVNVEAYRAKNELDFIGIEEMGLQLSTFDPEAPVADIRRRSIQAASEGWRGLYVVSDCSGMLNLLQDAKQWINVEALVEERLRDQPVKLLCQYNAASTPGDILATILKIHPIIGLGTSLGTNPFFVDPSELLTHPYN